MKSSGICWYAVPIFSIIVTYNTYFCPLIKEWQYIRICTRNESLIIIKITKLNQLGWHILHEGILHGLVIRAIMLISSNERVLPHHSQCNNCGVLGNNKGSSSFKLCANFCDCFADSHIITTIKIYDRYDRFSSFIIGNSDNFFDRHRFFTSICFVVKNNKCDHAFCLQNMTRKGLNRPRQAAAKDHLYELTTTLGWK